MTNEFLYPEDLSIVYNLQTLHLHVYISQWSSYEVKTRLFASVNTSLLHLSPLLVSLLHLSPVSLVIIVSSLWLKLSLRCWSWLGSPISTFNPSLIGSKL